MTWLNYNTAGVLIEAERVDVPQSAPYGVRLKHHYIKKETPSCVEIWQYPDKSGSSLTEEPYTGSVSESGKFQVDYEGMEDGDVQYCNTILFHPSQAGTIWYVWYKSCGDVVDAEIVNDLDNRLQSVEAWDSDGDGIVDRAREADNAQALSGYTIDDIALRDHNHDSTYAPLSHTHSGSDITSPVEDANKVGGYQVSTSAQPNTVAVRDNNASLSASTFNSTATGSTPPLTVQSSTKVANLNADLVDGYHAGNSSGEVAVSNGTVCTNLNADMLDGQHASAFASASHNHDSVYVRKATADTITAVHTFNPPSAGAPFTLGTNAQGQLVTGLNADKVDGYDVGNNLGQVPVSNNTVCTGLNADRVDSLHFSVSSNQLQFSQDGSSWRMVRVTYISTNAPSSSDGVDGDVWLRYQ